MSAEPRHSWIRRTASSVKGRTAATLAVLALVFALNVVVTFGFIQQQEADGNVINVAGRQRMLSQKMSKEAFAISAGNEQLRTTLEETASEFDGSLTGLLEGNAERGLPAARGEVKTQLEQVRALWGPFHQQVQVIQTASVASPEFEAALAHIAENSVLLLNEMDTAVGLYEGQFSGKINTLQWVVVGLAVVGALVAAGAWWLLMAGLAHPLSKLADAASRLGRGELHHRVDINTASEVGTVAREFNAMANRLGEMHETLELANTELQAGEAKYRTFFENVQDIFFQTDTNGVIVEISPSVERFGYTRDALIGTSVLEIYEDPEQRVEVVTAILEHGEISDFEIRLKSGDGRVVDISISAHARYDADGVRLGMEGVLRDISLRKQAENALRESESQVRVLLENASQGIVVIDSAGRIQLINARTEELFGYKRVELIGQSIDMLLPERLRRTHAIA